MKKIIWTAVMLVSAHAWADEQTAIKPIIITTTEPSQNVVDNTDATLAFYNKKQDDSIRVVNRYVGVYQTKEHPKFGEGITEKGLQLGFEDHTFKPNKFMYGISSSVMLGQYDGSYLFKKGDIKTHSIHFHASGDIGYGTPELYAGLRAGHYARTIGLGEKDIETVMRANYLSFITGGKMQVTEKIAVRAEIEKTLVYKWQTAFGSFDHDNKPFVTLAIDYAIGKNNTLQLFAKYKEYAQSNNMQKYVDKGKTYYMYEPRRTESVFGLNWRYEW